MGSEYTGANIVVNFIVDLSSKNAWKQRRHAVISMFFIFSFASFSRFSFSISEVCKEVNACHYVRNAA